mmetsp:Transcript_13159/g.39812  ORF Transcript_13159/g.39812 Transcript_13159/m.39812 type:complete len:217 (-) Transcript_13159:4566-5216(-)
MTSGQTLLRCCPRRRTQRGGSARSAAGGAWPWPRSTPCWSPPTTAATPSPSPAAPGLRRSSPATSQRCARRCLPSTTPARLWSWLSEGTSRRTLRSSRGAPSGSAPSSTSPSPWTGAPPRITPTPQPMAAAWVPPPTPTSQANCTWGTPNLSTHFSTICCQISPIQQMRWTQTACSSSCTRLQTSATNSRSTSSNTRAGDVAPVPQQRGDGLVYMS